MNEKEFQEICHCGGQITVFVRTDENGNRGYQLQYRHANSTGPMALFAVWAIVAQRIAIAGSQTDSIRKCDPHRHGSRRRRWGLQFQLDGYPKRQLQPQCDCYRQQRGNGQRGHVRPRRQCGPGSEPDKWDPIYSKKAAPLSGCGFSFPAGLVPCAVNWPLRWRLT